MNGVLQSIREFHVSSLGAALLVGYAVVLGGAIGSFLNVVAYRLPLGMSLSRPGSRCPKCERPIRPWHNVPVLGWLLLRGRCRDCGAPISPRYPAVELLVAVASGVVCWKSLTPAFDVEIGTYTLNVPAVLLRLSLIYLLFCSALLEFDGSRLPLRLNLAAALLLALGALLVPELRPPQPFSESPIPPASVLVFPLAAAITWGLLSWPLMMLPPAGTPASAAARLLLFVLVALVLGGLATVGAALLAAVAVLGSDVVRIFWKPAGRFGWAAALLLVTLLWVLVAGPDLGSNEMVQIGDTILAPENTSSAVAAAGIATALLTLVARFVYWLSSGSRSTR